MRAVLMSLAVLVTAPAFAQDQVILWKDLTVGMSRDDFRAAIPDEKIALTAECVASVDGKFSRDRLSAVTLSMSGIVMSRSAQRTRERCAEIVLASLIDKYGDNYVRSENIVGRILAHDVAEWAPTGPVSIRFESDKRNKARFWVTYAYVPPADAPAEPEAIDNL